jgi:uncharacterized membrane protein HdeD (DUF308 family)
MLQLLSGKWWVILLQGILLITLSFYIFNNPVEVLEGLSFWFGLIVLVTGLLGVATWFGADELEKEDLSLLWSILTIIFGVLILLNLAATMKSITIVFGFWMLVTGMHLTKTGWSLKGKNSLGWAMVIAGVLSVAAAAMMIFNVASGAVGISTLLGLQVLLAGIAMVLLSFVKKQSWV